MKKYTFYIDKTDPWNTFISYYPEDDPKFCLRFCCLSESGFGLPSSNLKLAEKIVAILNAMSPEELGYKSVHEQ